jgi:uncharacterized protein
VPSTPEPQYDVVVERDVPMRARDGVVLRSDIYRPDAEGTFPVLVVRTAYDKNVRWTPEGKPAVHVSESHWFPQRGYVVVVQDTRGRFASDGEFVPFVDDALDGYDTIEWAATLPWSNGKVASVGQSYQALTQYLTAPEQPPSLVAMSAVSGPVQYFDNCVWRGGVFELGWMLPYFLGLSYETLRRNGRPEAKAELEAYLEDPTVRFSPFKDEHYRHLPILDWGDRLAEGAPYFANLLRHSTNGPFWDQTDVLGRVEEIDAPTLHVGSWYDSFQPDGHRLFSALRERAATEEARRGQKLIMGPWGHIPYSHPTTQGAGDIDFGPEALIELHAIQLRWFEHYLNGVDNGVLDEPPVRIFVMGENVWRDEQEWPLARTQYTPLYLHSRGGANTRSGDGTLSFDAPADEPADGFVYDPNDPVPTRGGTTLMSLGMAGGVFDQGDIEDRKDVLVYTGEPLENDLEVTGPVTMTLYAATTAPDTDFTAKLIDVRPDGYAHNIVDGIVRARFRESTRHPTPVEPGRVIAYEIDLWCTSHLFKAGHRLRLEVSSSNFPRYDRNPNTGRPFGTDVELRTARQTIFHDGDRASHVTLPIIPR